MNTRVDAIRALASRLADLDPRTNSDISFLGIVAGALYSLEKADQLDYRDARRDVHTTIQIAHGTEDNSAGARDPRPRPLRFDSPLAN